MGRNAVKISSICIAVIAFLGLPAAASVRGGAFKNQLRLLTRSASAGATIQSEFVKQFHARQ